MPPAARPQPKPVQPEFDFDHALPAGRETFAAWELAAFWRVTPRHILNLVEAGEFGDAAFNLAKTPDKTRATHRIPRAAVVAFLDRRRVKPAA